MLNRRVFIRNATALMTAAGRRVTLQAEQSSWPHESKVAKIRSSFDQSIQRAIWWAPAGGLRDKNRKRVRTPLALVVALHTWQGSYDQTAPGVCFLRECQARGWAMIHPDFRGPNSKPSACGSDAVVSDIVDAVQYAQSVAMIDDARIYLLGASGGGYTSLVLAHRRPEIWAGISVWCPITDLSAWHGWNLNHYQNYSRDLEKVCGGAPGASAAVDREYYRRSPIHFLSSAKDVPIDINCGIHDGHSGSVPISHSLRAFNVLANASRHSDRAIGEQEIEIMVSTQRVPPSLGEPPRDETYSKRILFRRELGPSRITVFDGGHDNLNDAAFAWLAKQRKSEVQIKG